MSKLGNNSNKQIAKGGEEIVSEVVGQENSIYHRA